MWREGFGGGGNFRGSFFFGIKNLQRDFYFFFPSLFFNKGARERNERENKN